MFSKEGDTHMRTLNSTEGGGGGGYSCLVVIRMTLLCRNITPSTTYFSCSFPSSHGKVRSEEGRNRGPHAPFRSVTSLFSYFLENTTFHGLPQIFGAPFFLERLFWVLAFLTCLGVFTYQGKAPLRQDTLFLFIYFFIIVLF